MSLGGTQYEHLRKAKQFLESTIKHAKIAMHASDRGRLPEAWKNYAIALVEWGSYLAEVHWTPTGRIPEEDKAQKMLDQLNAWTRAHMNVW